MVAARQRAVEIKIMVPREFTDSAVVETVSRELCGEPLSAGVEFYQFQPAIFHCKVLVVDDDWQNRPFPEKISAKLVSLFSSQL